MEQNITISSLSNYLDFFDKMYDAVRLVDPLKKRVLDIHCKSTIETEAVCHAYWGNNKICDNCISMRAYLGGDTFVKLENTHDRLYMVTAIPIENGNSTVVLELLKNVTKQMLIGAGEYDKGYYIKNIVEDMNKILVKDTLTQLFNRKYINERLPADIIRSTIKQQPLSIIICDIDLFKEINDTYGHAAGDKAIKASSDTLVSCIRDNVDWVARYGGDEFLICLDNTDYDDAWDVAERMRKKIENTDIEIKDQRINITASFGICTLKDKKLTPEQMIECADQKLYQAKTQGRNRVG